MDASNPRNQAIHKLGELIEKIRVAMLTTVAHDGKLRCRPITTQGSTFDGNLWFLTRRSFPKTDEVREHRQVCLSFSRPEENTYVSVSGRAELVSDGEKLKQLWNPDYAKWFPGGPDDPDLALIRVVIERAEYWDAPSLAWRTMAGFVVLEPAQWDDPEYHAKIVWEPD